MEIINLYNNLKILMLINSKLIKKTRIRKIKK